jgi:hypothetical protein
VTPAELVVIAEVWAEDFAGVQDAHFIAAAREYRKRHSFFPAGCKAMLEICEELHEAEMERQRRKRRALPCEETPPDSEKIQQIISMCQRVIDAMARQ